MKAKEIIVNGMKAKQFAARVGRGSAIHIARQYLYSDKPYDYGRCYALCGAGENSTGSKRRSAVRQVTAEVTCKRCKAIVESK